MYPIECFTLGNEDKTEAVRYYIDLNKTYLKEVSKEEYELFAEFLKGEGKDILERMKDAKTERELYLHLNRIESCLPYAKNLREHKTLEAKVSAMHKELARLALRDAASVHQTALKQQRVIAEEYDNLLESINKYKDCVREYAYLKSKIADPESIKAIFASKLGGLGMNEIGQTIKNAIDQRAQSLKEARRDAFDSIKNYSVKEQMYLISQERLSKDSAK